MIVPQSSAQAVVAAYVYPLTGEIRLSNDGATNFPIVFYEVFYSDALAAGGLNPANGVWLSIADTYDAGTPNCVNPGNVCVDAVNQWMELPSNSRRLNEGIFNGAGTSSLPAARSISLGDVWNPNIVLPSQLTVRVATDAQPNAIAVDIKATIDGDYNLDRTVDVGDYNVWKNLFGVPMATVADGNHDGIVNAADYTVWRDHLGQTLVGTPFAAGAGEGASGGLNLSGGAAIPEPTSVVLACGMFAALGFSLVRRRR